MGIHGGCCSCKVALFKQGHTKIFILGVAARETAQALKTLAQAARGVAASTSDPTAAHAMLDSARDVMEGSAMLIQEAKQALVAPGDAESQQRLAQVRRGMGHVGAEREGSTIASPGWQRSSLQNSFYFVLHKLYGWFCSSLLSPYVQSC